MFIMSPSGGGHTATSPCALCAWLSQFYRVRVRLGNGCLVLVLQVKFLSNREKHHTLNQQSSSPSRGVINLIGRGESCGFENRGLQGPGSEGCPGEAALYAATPKVSLKRGFRVCYRYRGEVALLQVAALVSVLLGSGGGRGQAGSPWECAL